MWWTIGCKSTGTKIVNIILIICLPVYLTCFHIVSVYGEIDDTETVQVKEGGFLNLHPGLHDLNGVQLGRDTGILTISDIRTYESGLYKALVIVNTHISGWRYKVDVHGKLQQQSLLKNNFNNTGSIFVAISVSNLILPLFAELSLMFWGVCVGIHCTSELQLLGYVLEVYPKIRGFTEISSLDRYTFLGVEVNCSLSLS